MEPTRATIHPSCSRPSVGCLPTVAREAYDGDGYCRERERIPDYVTLELSDSASIGVTCKAPTYTELR
jgi:hypothetical protein